MKNSYMDHMTAAQQAAARRTSPHGMVRDEMARQAGIALNARDQASSEATEIDEDGVRALPQDRLDSSIAQHNKLIEKIKADASGRELTPREESRLSDLQESLVVFNAEDERRRQPAGRKTSPDVRGSVAFPDAAPKGSVAASPTAAARSGVIFNAGTRDFSAHLFGAAPRADASAVNDYFNALATRTFDPRMATAIEGIGVDGGFSVPQIWYRGVIDQAMQASEFAQRCRVFPAESNNLTIPMLDTRNRKNGVAGLIARWSAEAEQQQPQVMKWTAHEMKLKKTFILSEASSELVEDGINYAQQLTEGMSLATAQALDAAILYGTGVGMPLGIINSPGALEIPKESGQVADTLTWGNLVTMYARLSPACQKRAVWFVTPDALPQLMAVKVPNTDAPALLSGGFNDAGAGAPAMTIFGRPVVVTEIAAQIGDEGDIVFADMSQYALLVKNGARMENSIGPGFDRDVVQFRMIMRVDGTPLWPTAITPYNGGAIQTWATYLAPRA